MFHQVMISPDLLMFLMLSNSPHGVDNALHSVGKEYDETGKLIESQYDTGALIGASAMLISAGLMGEMEPGVVMPNMRGQWLLRTAFDEKGRPRA